MRLASLLTIPLLSTFANLYEHPTTDALLRRTVNILQKVNYHQPQGYRVNLTRALRCHAKYLYEVGRFQESLSLEYRASVIFEDLFKENADVYGNDLALTSQAMCTCRRKLYELDPNSEDFRAYVGTLSNHSYVLRRLKRPHEECRLFAEAVGLYRELCKQNPQARYFRSSIVLRYHASALMDLGRHDEAAVLIAEYEALMEEAKMQSNGSNAGH